MKSLRTAAEEQVGQHLTHIFDRCSDPVDVRLENFPKYARRKTITRFITLYELFKRALHVKGSVVECGVFRGFGLMTWAHLSAVLEPANLTRRIYGFDSFEGFPEVTERDRNARSTPARGGLRADSYAELQALIDVYDTDRFLGHIDKVHLIKGDVVKTVPEFVAQNQHLVVSLLFLDLDLYDPTRTAIDHLLPRIPKGGIIAFDELDNPIWPGETVAALESVGLMRLRLERFPWDPYVAFATIE
ncbi:MAG: class I SAM-dependent methyltransferase [Acidobacteria bacterium]|nr:class I SAM-dependent methyltransferase [Acidobacteriota bacterium]